MFKELAYYILPMLLISGSLAISEAQASVKHKKKNHPVFSAIDDDPGNLPDLESPVLVPTPVKRVRISRKRAAPIRRAQATPAEYDSVPPRQNAPILRRLALVEEMIRDYGRAYDYRIYTVHELETILAQLKAGRPRANESELPLSSPPPLPPPPPAAPDSQGSNTAQ